MNLCSIREACFKAILRYFHSYESVLPYGKGTTANLYSHLEYNAKVISAETIARVLDGEAQEQHETASGKTTSETTSKSAPKKTGGRKKKSDPPVSTGESQVSRL